MRHRRRQRGQALVEMALVAPFLLILLVGSAQVGVIAYGNVTMDTAAREGARMASQRPVNATTFAGSSQTYTGCKASDVSTNYTVQAVCNNAGMLDKSQITVKISKSVDVTASLPPSAIHLLGSCAAGYKTLSGAVNGIPAGQNAHITTDADNTINVTVPSSNPNYSVCLPHTSQTVSANVGTGCTGYHDSTALDPQTTPTYTFTLVANPPCQTAIATSTSLSANPTSVQTGQNVTLTATVTPASGGSPTGTVTFSDTTGGTPVTLGTATLSGGTAQLSTTALPVGARSIVATYNPDATHSGSTSAPAIVTVSSAGAATTTTLSASPSTVQQGSPVTLTATVSAASGTPTGTVTFIDTSSGSPVTLGTATLVGGTATLATSTLAAGSHSITASYGGDATNAASSSPPATLTVTSSGGGGSGPPGPGPYTCTDPPAGMTTMYVQIDVTYPEPIFVPIVGSLFSNASGSRNVTITQVIRVEPCGMTQGQ